MAVKEETKRRKGFKFQDYSSLPQTRTFFFCRVSDFFWSPHIFIRKRWGSEKYFSDSVLLRKASEKTNFLVPFSNRGNTLRLVVSVLLLWLSPLPHPPLPILTLQFCCSFTSVFLVLDWGSKWGGMGLYDMLMAVPWNEFCYYLGQGVCVSP